MSVLNAEGEIIAL